MNRQDLVTLPGLLYRDAMFIKREIHKTLKVASTGVYISYMYVRIPRRNG
jgi:hypothetical protein